MKKINCCDYQPVNKRLIIVFLLGFSSGMPLALLTGTLQAWFSVEGMSIAVTGMLSLTGIPYLYKMFWAPLLDRYGFRRLGRRRTWMLFSQLGLVAGFNLMAWLSPLDSPGILILLAFILTFFSATQDTAVDAQRVEYLPESLHGLGVSLAVMAYRLALVISGGVALLLAGSYGWSAMYRMMGFLMLTGVAATLYSTEPPSASDIKHTGFWQPLTELFSRKGIFLFLGFILIYKMGEVFTSSSSGMMMPFLIQGMGFSLDSIAYVNKILGIVSILLGGLCAGLILMRCPLYYALLVFGILQASANLLFVALSRYGADLQLFALAVMMENFASGLATTALVALFMRVVDKRFTATQFSLLVAISSLPRVLSGPIAAFLQSLFGWTGLYEFAFICALGFIPCLMRLRHSFNHNVMHPAVWNETVSREYN